MMCEPLSETVIVLMCFFGTLFFLGLVVYILGEKL